MNSVLVNLIVHFWLYDILPGSQILFFSPKHLLLFTHIIGLFLQNTGWVWLVNLLFMFLAMFHLSYLGLMFKSEPNMQEFDYQVLLSWLRMNTV